MTSLDCEIEVVESDLSTRAKNVLNGLNIRTNYCARTFLVNESPLMILKQPNCGRGTLDEIISFAGFCSLIELSELCSRVKAVNEALTTLGALGCPARAPVEELRELAKRSLKIIDL